MVHTALQLLNNQRSSSFSKAKCHLNRRTFKNSLLNHRLPADSAQLVREEQLALFSTKMEAMRSSKHFPDNNNSRLFRAIRAQSSIKPVQNPLLSNLASLDLLVNSLHKGPAHGCMRVSLKSNKINNRNHKNLVNNNRYSNTCNLNLAHLRNLMKSTKGINAAISFRATA